MKVSLICMEIQKLTLIGNIDLINDNPKIATEMFFFVKALIFPSIMHFRIAFSNQV